MRTPKTKFQPRRGIDPLANYRAQTGSFRRRTTHCPDGRILQSLVEINPDGSEGTVWFADPGQSAADEPR